MLAVSATRTDAARWALALLGLVLREVLGLDWQQVDLDTVVSESMSSITVYPYRHGCAR